MNIYLVRQDSFDETTNVAVLGTLDEVRSFVKQHPAKMRPSMFVELRDVPTDKSALLRVFSDLLAGTPLCPETPGALLRTWSVTPRGGLQEDTDVQ